MFKQFIPKALRQKSSLAIIITAVVLVETTSIVQYFFTLNAIRDEVDHRAKSELRAKSMEMHNIITEVESAINNSVWIVERYLDQPDSTYTITSQLVKQNPDIVGATVSFIADYYPQYGRWCELYSFMKADGTIEQRQIGGPTHDYLNKDWFLEGMAAEKGYWSEPYYDEEGAKMMLCSYLVPIRDAKGKVVGLLDADIYGPSVPQMLGIAGERPKSEDGQTLLPLQAHGVQAMSIGFLVDVESPMVWRGPMATQALNQLLNDTAWRALDYLIIDLPPGTGDIQLTLAQRVPLTGAVIVTTPQDIALLDARKGLKMFEKVNVPILGVVENMSLHVCSHCGHTETIFGEGGGERLCADYGVPFLGKLPLDIPVLPVAVPVQNVPAHSHRQKQA